MSVEIRFPRDINWKSAITSQTGTLALLVYDSVREKADAISDRRLRKNDMIPWILFLAKTAWRTSSVTREKISLGKWNPLRTPLWTSMNVFEYHMSLFSFRYVFQGYSSCNFRNRREHEDTLWSLSTRNFQFKRQTCQYFAPVAIFIYTWIIF